MEGMIEQAMKGFQTVRLSAGDHWMVWDSSKKLWCVWCPKAILETADIQDALDKLVENEPYTGEQKWM